MDSQSEPAAGGDRGSLWVVAREKVVTMEFIKKYIHVAKLVKPVLTQEASDHISEQYSRLRSHDQVNSDSARVTSLTRCILT